MKIYVDADACPNTIKNILYKTARRTQTQLILVANRPLTTPSHKLIHTVQVSPGLDVADYYIAEQVTYNDLVITADIPLAKQVLDKNATALNPRGELYTHDNIKQRLSMRDFMQSLRDAGIDTGGPKALDQRDNQRFANALDRFLTRHSH